MSKTTRLHPVRTRRPRSPNRAAVPVITSSRTAAPLPFRWDVAEEEKLGTLLEGERASTCWDFEDFLRRLMVCSARVVAFAGDADLVFVGRSLESQHDLLLGLLADTPWRDRLTLLPFSAGRSDRARRLWRDPQAIAALREHLNTFGLSPQRLALRERPVALVDIVSGGTTFERVVRFLHDWAVEERADWGAARRKLRLVGVRAQTKNSPNTWRWQQHAPWLSELLGGAGGGRVMNVSVDRPLYSFLADLQDKTTRSYTPEAWGRPEFAVPHRAERHLRALRLARSLFEEGRTQARREEFAALLSEQREMREEWLRRLVLEVRTSGGSEAGR